MEGLSPVSEAGIASPIAEDVASVVPSAVATGATTAPRTPRRRVQTLGLRVGAGILILALWQFVVTLWAPSYIATPLGTIQAIPDTFADPMFTDGVGGTLLATVEGLLISVVLGTVLGLVMGRLPDLNRVLGMYVGAFYAIPLVAIVPLITVWFGYTPTARLVMVVIEGVLPIIYNVAEGARAVGAQYLDVTRIHHAPWWRVWGGVVLPNSVPYALAALVGAVVAEFVTAIPGLGYFILFNVRSFHQDEAMVSLLVLVAFALVVRALVGLAVARGLPWYRPAKES
jgi:ABC-type nitrate/sulfonate/bicarbonate transport system permease component